ncbi:MAG TPA: hypothetical protein VGK73_07815 [Polyangiaceae bacterium]
MAQASRALLIVLLASACSSNQEGPVRSPARDYPHQPPRTSDGQVLGADGKAPGELLEESATTDHLAPGWTADEHGLKYNPKRPAGATDETGVPEQQGGRGAK